MLNELAKEMLKELKENALFGSANDEIIISIITKYLEICEKQGEANYLNHLIQVGNAMHQQSLKEN